MSEQQHSGYSQLRVRRLVVTLDGLPVSKNELLDIFSGFGRLDIGRKRDDCIIQDDNDNPSVWIVCCDSYAEADNIRQRADRFLVRGTLLRVQFENVESRHLYVSGFIGYDTAQALETAMAAVFSRFGRIRSMRPLLPSNGGPIEYDDVSSAMAALAAMQDYPHQGRRVTVETRSAAVAARTAAKYAIIQRHRDRPASTASAASSAASSSSLSNGHHDGGGYRGPLIVDSRHQQGSSRSPPRGSLSMHRSDETFRPAVVDYGRRVVRHVDLDDTRDRDRERDREPRYHQQQQQRHRYSPQASSSSAVAAAAARDPVGSAIVQMSTSTAAKDPVGAAIVQMSTTTASSVIMSDAATPIKTGGSSSVLASIMSPKAAIAVSQSDRFDRFNDNRNGGGDDDNNDDYDSGYQSGGGGFYEQGQIPDNQQQHNN